MIDKNDFKQLLKYLNFVEEKNIYTKSFGDNFHLKVDFIQEKMIYPIDKGLKLSGQQTCNFSQKENVVVFECIHRLFTKGYKPEHLEIERKYSVGHNSSGGRADIVVTNQENKELVIIECKTYGNEFDKAWNKMQITGGQLFTYAQQTSQVEFLCLYASKFNFKESKIDVQQKIISHKDNEAILEKNEKLKSFRESNDVDERFSVWKNTYQLEFTESGIFEDSILAYQIGKDKYTLSEDTDPVDSDDKKGKYHLFRTILRKHNIARKETAFEVLVNLFLAKIVDEKNQPIQSDKDQEKGELQFYWKGIAYDNYFDLMDRLQELYQKGMKDLLDEDVMYISNEQIDNAFWMIKNRKSTIKQEIQNYFRELKFFSNNAFSLINVHNEAKFNQNTKVLVELVKMWQNKRLVVKEESNQFLGDMFEYFLDNSIKQSEGQFFTPIPITKFIISSLPLENKIKNIDEPIKVIDFACGSGHFLTEYAHQIEPLVKKYSSIGIEKYYNNIFGIEKEDRLAKIAKVSAHMYGQDDIQIHELDALIDSKKISNESFDVLVANPPFAVQGFLQNLEEKDKQNYDLTKKVNTQSDTNNIQCFFIERAKQLVKPNGVVGIIVPSSVISNSDATHIGTREIILKYFNLVALVELGSGTFGKTGTNTIVLFLQRKAEKPEQEKHYLDRVNDFFKSSFLRDTEIQKIFEEYQDQYLIEKYCEHIEIPFQDYIQLFGVTEENFERIEPLLKTDLFQEYHKDFLNKAEIKNLKQSKTFKEKTQKEQNQQINKRLIEYLHQIEKDKLFYFILAYENKQKVLIVKSPSENKKQKQFLGYEWSGSKGQEGIKYNGGDGIQDIITPLFDPKNLDNTSKINTLIRQNFLKQAPDHLDNFELYKEQISYVNTIDLLDFKRTDFNKSFSLTAQQNIEIQTKWRLVKLGEVVDLLGGFAFKSTDYVNNSNTLNFRQANIKPNGFLDLEYKKVFLPDDFINKYSRYILEDGDIVIAMTDMNKELNLLAVPTIIKKNNQNLLLNQRVGKFINYKLDKVILNYLVHILKYEKMRDVLKSYGYGNVQSNLSKNDLLEIKIPLPPKEVQQEIVKECEQIDQKTQQAETSITQAKFRIESLFLDADSQSKESYNLGNRELFNISIGKRVVQKEIENQTGTIPIYSANVFEPFGFINKKLITDFSVPSILWGIDGDWMVNYMPANKPFYPTDHCGIVRVKSNKINARYLVWVLDRAGKEVRFSRNHRASIDRIRGIKIQIPKIELQNKLVTEIELLETKIKQAQETIDSSKQKKQNILNKYLN